MSLLRSRRLYLATAFAALAATGLVVTSARPQRRTGGSRFAQLERAAIAQPFVGVTADGNVQAGLFPVRSTGISTRPVLDAARAFLAALPDEQRGRARFAVDDPEWRRWANQHSLPRQGVPLAELDEGQRNAAYALLQAGLSAKGFQRSRDIMRLNHTLGEITSNFEELDEWLYYLTFMGEPSEHGPWGWQLDGHHLIVNYFVLGDQVVMTPTFMGSEPVVAESGKYEGVAVMQDEQRRGLDLVRSLTSEQRAKAVLATGKAGNSALAEAFRDNIVLDYAGIPASDLNPDQRELLLALVGEYVGNMSDGHAGVKMAEVRQYLGQTYFAWIGESGPQSTFYYRVHSPVILIEFDHQRPVFLRHLPRRPTRQHIHSVTRTPNGNDYGKDLLRQHYERQHRAELAAPRAAPGQAGAG